MKAGTRSCFVALGSNLGDSLRILSKSLALVANALNGRIVGCSKVYRSRAEDYLDQPDFINAVVQLQVSSELAPNELLHRIKEIEQRYHKSHIRFGPRELDLDILGFDDNCVVEHRGGSQASDRELFIPHRRAHTRDFVLRPLCDIPDGRELLLGPHGGERADKLLSDLNRNQVQKAFPLRNKVFCGKKEWPDRSSSISEDTLLMGILNITPDSFSDGGEHNKTVADAVAHALELCKQGADVIDVGGASSRPFAEEISKDEELARVIPVISALSKLDHKDFPCSVSVDTMNPDVAREAVLAGADIINDSAGEEDSEMQLLEVAGELGVPIASMHTRGNPRTMESLVISDTEITDGVLEDRVWKWLNQRARSGLEIFNIPRWNVMLDPGLGFAKSAEQNLRILAGLDKYTRIDDYPVLIGSSRKRFVSSMTRFDVDVATSATCTSASLFGAAMVRVHSIKETRDALNVSDSIKRARQLLG